MAYKSMPGPESKGILVLMLTAFLWSTSGVAIKLIDWNPMAICGGRSAIAFLFLLAAVRNFRIPKAKFDILAALSFAACMFMFVIANKMTTSANAIFLQYLSPAFTAVFGILFLNERPNFRDWILLAGMGGGMALFFAEKLEAGGVWGDIIAVVSGIFMALFIVFMRKSKDISPVNNMMLGHLITAVVAVPFFSIGQLPTPAGFGGLAYMGVIQIGLTSLLFAYGVRRLPALTTSIIILLEPILNPAWVYFLVGEIPSKNALIGGSIIIGLVFVKSFVTQSATATEKP